MKAEKRIYVVVAATVKTLKGVITQPVGRQVAQACHAVSKLRLAPWMAKYGGPVTTIVLQARDSAELHHVYQLAEKAKLRPVSFNDENKAVYGEWDPSTAFAFLSTRPEIDGIADYLPIWGS
jgi:hypothetical protein